MPAAVTVTGRFIDRYGRPLPGLVRFTPQRLWVIQRGICWACLAPEVWTDEEAAFTVWLTPTDSDSIPWDYLVHTPAGRFKVPVPYHPTGHTLRTLIDVAAR